MTSFQGIPGNASRARVFVPGGIFESQRMEFRPIGVPLQDPRAVGGFCGPSAPPPYPRPGRRPGREPPHPRPDAGGRGRRRTRLSAGRGARRARRRARARLRASPDPILGRLRVTELRESFVSRATRRPPGGSSVRVDAPEFPPAHRVRGARRFGAAAAPNVV